MSKILLSLVILQPQLHAQINVQIREYVLMAFVLVTPDTQELIALIRLAHYHVQQMGSVLMVLVCATLDTVVTNVKLKFAQTIASTKVAVLLASVFVTLVFLVPIADFLCFLVPIVAFRSKINCSTTVPS